MSEEQRVCIKNYNTALLKIQDFKEIFTNQINNWELDNQSSDSISISLPKNFFVYNSPIIDYQLNALQYFEIFKKLFEEDLKRGVRSTLERGLSSTAKSKPDYILLSGGSSKIGWLYEFIKRDFHNELSAAIRIKLDNFKEVVSLGLAVECARRFCNQTGDFADTTYNKINVVLNPNDNGYEIPLFKSDIFKLDSKGLVIPSSSVLRQYFNKELKWRFRLTKEPRNRLSYYFLKDKLDPSKPENIQNIIDNNLRVTTKSFDKHLELTLTIKEDGTAIPLFRFNSLKLKNSSVMGKPFAIDMTYGDSPTVSEAYLGIDFGTTNSSVSYVSTKHIEKYEKEAIESENELFNEIRNNSPVLISYQFAKFRNSLNDSEKAKIFINLFENSLSLLYYIALLELKINDQSFNLGEIKFHKSAGSLVYSIKTIKSKIKNNFIFSGKYVDSFNEEAFQTLTTTVDFINDFKHTKFQIYDFDFDSTLKVVFKAIKQLIDDVDFGFFHNLSMKPFQKEYLGNFMLAHGNGIFSEKLDYKGEKNIHKEYCYIYDHRSGKALNLFPFSHWGICDRHKEEDYGHLYIFDKYESENLLFSTAKGNCKKIIKSDDPVFNVFNDSVKAFNQSVSRYSYEELNISERVK